jgi:prepilin-type N-terminal cleavage/methylation domain-containing protein
MSSRRGFTLLEVMVVLVLIGLASALVAPSLLSPQRRTDDAVARLIDSARRAAVQRAGPVTLSIATNGSWVLEADGVEPRRGTVNWPHLDPVRIHVSALGACTLGSTPASDRATAQDYNRAGPSLAIDAVQCRLFR